MPQGVFSRLGALVCLAALTSCGGGGGGTPPPPPAVTISISPTSAALFVSSTQQFTAAVNNTTNTTVTWSVNGTAGGNASVGTISSAGLYTAPATVPNPANVTVTATSQADTSKSASASVSLTYPAPVVASVSPSSGAVGSDTPVTVAGSNFVMPSVINFKGASVATTFISSTALTATLPTSTLAAGAYPLTVVNPGPGGGTSNSVNFTVAPPAASISGTAANGTISGATVTITAVNTDGTDGTVLGTVTTDSSGNFSVPLSPAPSGPIRVTVTGGTSTSLATGKTVANTSKLSAILDSAAGNTSGVAVTPLTEFVNSLTVSTLAGGGAGMARGARPALSTPFVAAHAASNLRVVKFAGLPASTPSETVIPSFTKSAVSSDPNGFTLGLFLGALSQQGQALIPSSPNDLISALSKDIADGVFDGKGSGPIPLGSGTLPSTAGTTDLLTNLNGYTLTGQTILNNGITAMDAAPAVSAVSSGVSTSNLTPSAVGLLPGTSGAIASISFGGKQYVFFPTLTNGVGVIDVTDPANLPPVKTWPFVTTVLFNGIQVRGVISALGIADHAQVLVFASGSKHIALLNANVLATGTPGVDDSKLTDFQTDLPITNTVDILGSPAFVAGGIPDNGRKGVWLATGDGYSFFDLTTDTLTQTFPIVAPNLLAIDLGGDIPHNFLLGGNDLGVQLVDLVANKSYIMDQTFFNNNIFPVDFFGGVAGNAVDSGLQVAVMVSNGSTTGTGTAFLMNMATISKTNATPPATSTFIPAPGGFITVPLLTATPLNLSGAGVDDTTHTAFFTGVSSAGLAVAQLQDPASVPAGGSWAGLADWITFSLDNSPVTSGFFSGGEPYTFGVAFNLATNKPFAYSLAFIGVGTVTHILQVDMQGFLSMPRAGTTGDAAHMPSSDPVAAGFIKLISF